MSAHAATADHLHHDEEHPPEVIWSAKTPINLMGMLFFIGSEIALFGSFFMSYFFIRVAGEADYSSWAHQVGDVGEGGGGQRHDSDTSLAGSLNGTGVPRLARTRSTMAGPIWCSGRTDGARVAMSFSGCWLAIVAGEEVPSV